MCELERLFNRFMGLKGSLQCLASVVQNPMTVTEEELEKWESEEVARFKAELDTLLADVREYYKSQ